MQKLFEDVYMSSVPRKYPNEASGPPKLESEVICALSSLRNKKPLMASQYTELV